MSNDWHALGSVQYRKWHVYDMAWDVDPLGRPFALENFVVCGAPFGGPIAMYLDPKKPGNDATKPTYLLIYTSSGVKLAQFEWRDQPIVGIGWTDKLNLVVVAENGLSTRYLAPLSFFYGINYVLPY